MKIFTMLATLMLTTPVAAQELVGSYVAYIGEDDLYNSRGARLSEPWQVLRQDRANFHRFGISQLGDEWDPFFADVENRAIMEQMVQRGTIDPASRRDLLSGGATVLVRIFSRGNQGDYVEIAVVR
ncbi:hypothetical protein SAMN05444004_10671 [Jannaschia faecimaris]|uniref:Uncharacterized protein n=1 Tax=Jannaschia faecimaris TaxID=1244108 RepID=A0A1H3QBR2_9RHOB|nr:hypothetical protein [Jannaschia faecimaris]SDZ10994.1 hypothetical protein SAMN05444004_10671 [Jannaschia faecimaris]